MKAKTKKVFWVIGCIAIFIVTFVIFFILGIFVPMIRMNNLLKVDWSDKTGTVLKDLNYDDGEYTVYDLYIPTGLDKDKPQSLILFIHGGGFVGGDKSEKDGWCKYLACKGYITATANYTVRTNDNTSNLNLMDEEISTCVQAIKDECSSRGYNLTEMAVSGESAGGCLAMLYAYKHAETSPIPIKFVFQQTGPANFEPEQWGNNDASSKSAFATVMTGLDITEEMIENGSYVEYIKAISPAAYVNENTVPTLCAYGPKDKIVPVEIKYTLFEQFDKYGVTYEYIEYPNSGHSLLGDLDKQKIFIAKSVEYCNRYFENK